MTKHCRNCEKVPWIESGHFTDSLDVKSFIYFSHFFNGWLTKKEIEKMSAHIRFWKETKVAQLAMLTCEMWLCNGSSLLMLSPSPNANGQECFNCFSWRFLFLMEKKEKKIKI